MTDGAISRHCALPDQIAVRVHGLDAADFLQAQLINDVRPLNPERSQLSGWCNPKGRLLAVFRLFRDADGWFLRLPAELAGATVQRLRMFVLRAQVRIEPLQEAWAGLAVWGERSAEALRGAGVPAPEAADGVAWHAGVAVLRVPGRAPRFECWGPAETVHALAESCARHGAAPAPRTAWELEEIQAGLPEIHTTTREQFVPQTVNLDLVGGLSFSKGCFPGQEIVARTKYLGKLKRRMFRLRANADAAEPGQAVYRPERSPTDPAGTVVRWAPSTAGGIELLASLRIEDHAAGGLTLGDPDGPGLKPLPLPYPITVEQGT